MKTPSNYYYQTRNGKRVRVKKGLKRKLGRDTISGTTAALTSTGFITGSGLLGQLTKNQRPIIRNLGYGAGAVGGSVVATILANRTFDYVTNPSLPND